MSCYRISLMFRRLRYFQIGYHLNFLLLKFTNYIIYILLIIVMLYRLLLLLWLIHNVFMGSHRGVKNNPNDNYINPSNKSYCAYK